MVNRSSGRKRQIDRPVLGVDPSPAFDRTFHINRIIHKSRIKRVTSLAVNINNKNLHAIKRLNVYGLTKA